MHPNFRYGTFIRNFILVVGLVWCQFGSASKCVDTLSTKPAAAHGHKDLMVYIGGMNKSSHQKAAFAALVRSGHIGDFGSGSGISAFDLALMFPDSTVTGIDLDPEMIKWAKQTYRLSNLDYKVGNALEINFPKNSLTGAVSSSTGHHLTSYGEGLFDVKHVVTAHKKVYEQLKHGGLYVFRDFLIPEGPTEIILELPNNDGLSVGSYEELSSVAFFKIFAEEFRSGPHPTSGVPYKILEDDSAWTKIQVSIRDATEFLLRKDYRKTYEAERREEYLYMNQQKMEQSFRESGFRILFSSPIYNPWIIKNRFIGHAGLTDLEGRPLPFPATNYAIVGEKVSPEEGIEIRLKSSHAISDPKYLKLRRMKNRRTQEVWDVVERPNDTVDLLPYFVRRGHIYILGKQGFPRPILSTLSREESLTGNWSAGYNLEPINFIDQKTDSPFLTIERELKKRAGVESTEILNRGPGRIFQYYSSPGMFSEKVNSVAIPIRSRSINRVVTVENYSGLSTSGVIRAIEAQQVLRSAEGGSVLDSRLEIAVYNLLLDLGKSVGPWIGEEINLKNFGKINSKNIRQASDILSPKKSQRMFVPVDGKTSETFFEIKSGVFEEYNSEGQVIATTSREYVTTKNYSPFVISTIPVTKINNIFYVGLKQRDLPGVQLQEGTSNITTNPVWHLPKTIRSLDEATREVLRRLKEETNTVGVNTYSLGGSYYPTPGLTAETVLPIAVEVNQTTLDQSNLNWVSLKDLIENRHLIKDAHLFVVALRLAHALGVIK